jgi:hypothetical protein
MRGYHFVSLIALAQLTATLLSCAAPATPDPKAIANSAAATVSAMRTAGAPAKQSSDVTRVIEVTRVVDVTRIVPVTQVVEVTPTAASARLPAGNPSPSQPKPASTSAAGGATSAYLKSSVPLTLPPGDAGKLAIVAQGPVAESTVLLVVRNNTEQSVDRIKVSAVARTQGGQLFATGGDQGFTPKLVRPGELTLGYVYFSDTKLPKDIKLEFEVTGDPSDQFAGDLEISEHSVVQNRIVGMLRNTANTKVSGPIEVTAYCFSQAGQLLSDYSAFTDKNSALPGDTIPFQVTLRGPCPAYLLSAGGFSF